MMKHYYLIILSLLLSFNGKAQNKTMLSAIQMHQLDTIVWMEDICKFDNDYKGLSYCLTQNELVFNYHNPKQHKDTIIINRLNLSTKALTRQTYLLNGISNKLSKTTRITGIAVNQEYIVLLANSAIYSFQQTAPFQTPHHIYDFSNKEDFTAIKFIQNNDLMLSRSFHFKHLGEERAASKILLFNVENQTINKEITPHVANHALSFMRPYQVIDGTDGAVLIGQNYKYGFYVLSPELANITECSKSMPVWNAIDSAELNKRVALSEGNLSVVFDFLESKFMHGYAFCDGFFFRDKSTILVRYTLGQNNEDSLIRLYDTWRYQPAKKTFVRSDTTYYTDLKYNTRKFATGDTDLILNKTNFYYDTWLEPAAYGSNYTITFQKKSHNYPIGMTVKNYWREEQAFAYKNAPVLGIVILKNNN